MRRASRRQDSMRRESEDTPLLEKVEIFSDQGVSAPRSLAHICAKDLGASFPTAEIPQRRSLVPPSPRLLGQLFQMCATTKGNRMVLGYNLLGDRLYPLP